MSIQSRYKLIRTLKTVQMMAGGAIGGDVVFTRNSIGWDNELTAYAIDTPRIYDGQLVIEPERRNVLEYSSDLTAAAWVDSNAPVTADYAIAPNGVQEADLLGYSSDTQRILQKYSQSTPFDSVLSMFLWGDSSTQIYIGAGDGAVAVAHQDLVDVTTEPQRFSIFTPQNLPRETDLYLLAYQWGTFGLGGNPNLSAPRSVISWQAQAEIGAYPTTPIPTGATAVVRAADYASQDLSAEVTTVHQVHIDVQLAPGIGASGTADEYQVLRSMDDGTGNNGVEVVRRYDNTLRLRVINGGSVTVDQSLGTVTDSERVKIFVGHDGTDFYAQKTGGTLVQVTAALPSGRIERIGSRGHVDGAHHAHSGANHYTHIVYPDICSLSLGQTFIS